MFLHLSFILFTGGLPYTPLGRHPPLGKSPLHSACWDTVNKRAVRILLECNLVAYAKCHRFPLTDPELQGLGEGKQLSFRNEHQTYIF